MTNKSALLELASRCEKATGSDRELDAAIAEVAYGWKPAPVPPDARGENAGEVLTPDGRSFRKADGGYWVYPPVGKVHRAYHCEEYTRDCRDPAFPLDAIRQRAAAALRALAKEVDSIFYKPTTRDRHPTFRCAACSLELLLCYARSRADWNRSGLQGE